MNSLAIGDKLQTIKEIAIGGCEDIEVSEKIFDLCDEISGLVNSVSCNCKHNSNPRDNEPCCRCDSRHTNADRIRNMSDEELAEFIHKMEVTCFVDIIGYANKDCGQGKISCRECRAKAPTIFDWLQSEAE